MKTKVLAVLMILFFSGCGTLRFAPSEAQKQNAWLHNRTAAMIVENSVAEKTSEKFQQLAKLNELQSGVFVSYFGCPKELPKADLANDIMSEQSLEITDIARKQSVQRPDMWQAADSGLELAVGIFALFGGVFGTRAVQFLRNAKAKTKALQEIIEGNELFKKENLSSADSFKGAQKLQSAQTRQIVAQMK